MFKITVRQSGEVTIFDCAGKLVTGEPSLALREAVREQLQKGNFKIIVNMATVTYVDVSGLRELVSSYTKMRNKGGDLKILFITSQFRDMLRMTSMFSLFDTFECEEIVISSFRPVIFL